ncbi:MAG: hypothetical protein AAF632_20180 [Bacteroidota bacterium]
MLTFFRVNDPYRIPLIFGLLLIVRLPFFFGDGFLTLPELNWMLVGENLAEGNRLYTQLWENIGPLSALIYRLVDVLFSRSQVAYVILAAVLITYQCLIFNDFLLTKKAYHENTYVPALVYALLTCLSFDFYTLSPVLLSLTWVLLALRNIFYRIESQSRDVRILSTGIFIGLAVLCYLPSVIYFLSSLLAYLFFANLSLRRFFLLLYGFALPLLIAFTYFFLIEASGGFIQQYLLSLRTIERSPYIGDWRLLIVGLVPLAFLLVSAYRLGQYRRYTNQQGKLQRIMGIKILAALATLLLVRQLAPYHLLYFVPPIAFFITHFLLIIRRTLIAELVTAGLALLLVFNGYALLFNFFSLQRVTHSTNLMVQSTDYDELVAGKQVVFFGHNLSVYRNAYLATPYLNWSLAEKQLANLDDFKNVSLVSTAFQNDMPELIIDESGLIDDIFERIPAIKTAYRKLPGQPVYRRTKPEVP